MRPRARDAARRGGGEAVSGAGRGAEYSHQGATGRGGHPVRSAGAVDVEFPWIDHRHVIVDSGTLLAERNVVHYRLTEGKPLSAAVGCAVDVELERGDWRTRVEVRGEMTCTADSFLLTAQLDAFEDGVRRFARTWVHEIPRDGG